jgi:hypothetical protein
MDSLPWMIFFGILIVITVISAYFWTNHILKHQKREDNDVGDAISKHPIVLNPVFISLLLHAIVSFALLAVIYWLFWS